MKEPHYLPEGASGQKGGFTAEQLEKAAESGKILEATALRCDKEHRLHLDLGCMEGIIPPEECVYSPSAAVKDIAILSRVNRPVCFQVQRIEEGVAILSRRSAQRQCLEQYLFALSPGDIIPARVTHLEPFGAFVDLGCGIISLVNIENISVSRIGHPSDRFTPGQNIYVVVKGVEKDQGRIYVSHKELLGSWQQNADRFSVGETVTGIVRSVESYGVFVELTPNLAGLCEYRSDVEKGQLVSVFIKNIIPQRMKIKMLIISTFGPAPAPGPLTYTQTEGHISHWRYPPEDCTIKQLETDFDSSALPTGSSCQI